ncbi:hypothetical protein V8G54_023050, partial [Vigna mungo]
DDVSASLHIYIRTKFPPFSSSSSSSLYFSLFSFPRFLLSFSLPLYYFPTQQTLRSLFSLPFLSISPILTHKPHRSPPSVRRMSAPRAPSAAATATASSNPPDQIMHSMKRQLPFSSMKPPFAAAGDYHRFAPDHRRIDAEAVVVKTPVGASLI